MVSRDILSIETLKKKKRRSVHVDSFLRKGKEEENSPPPSTYPPFLLPFIYSLFSFQHGSERINRDGNQDKHKTEFLDKLLFGVTRSSLDSWLVGFGPISWPSVTFSRNDKRSRPSLIRITIITRGCTPDDINRHGV